MPKSLKILIVVVAISALSWIIFGGMYNQILTLSKAAERDYEQVVSEMEKKAKLIPSLVNIISAYDIKETDVLENTTKAKDMIFQAKNIEEFEQANNRLKLAITDLNIVIKNYPKVLENHNYIQLRDELEEFNSSIEVAKNDYNTSASNYNRIINKFPQKYLAAIFKAKDKKYFEMQVD